MIRRDTTPPAGGADQAVEPLELFEILVRENADSLTAFLRAAVRDPAAADDLFQETLLVAWRRIRDYDRSRPFGAWLRGIARRLVLAHYRAAARAPVVLDERALDYVDRRMAQIDRQPGEAFDEKIAALRDCIERLAGPYRESIELHYRQRRTTDWMSAHLAVTREAIQKRLQRARAKLAECLEGKAVFAAMEQPP